VRTLMLAVTAACLTGMVSGAFAEGNPSADQIIKSLTPTGDVSKAGSRGIRLRVEQPAVAPRSSARLAPVQSVAVMRPVTTPMEPSGTEARGEAAPAVNLTVNFPSGSAELTPSAIATLDALGTALASPALAQYRFRVEGHTDTMGSADVNRTLSERRAEAVVGYIAGKFGVAKARMVPVGMGSDDPLVPTGPQVPEPRNRRVNVVNLGA
jgi:OOP family OmpA-OmpF porin